MDYLLLLADRSVLAVALLLLLGQLLTHEIGYRIGAAENEPAPGQREHVGVVVTGMLGLLAFVLALTLSYSTARFSERRQSTIVEANAIGTAWLRAKAIGSPQAIEIAGLLENYLDVRQGFVQSGREPQVLAKANDETSALQQAIWTRVTAIVRERPDAISGALMSAVNETFDASTSERFAMGMQLPVQIFWLLLGVMLLSMAALDYQFGLKRRPVRIFVGILTVVWTAVIISILDLAAPRVGNFRTSIAVYEWTRQGFQSSGSANPAPAVSSQP